MWGHRLSMVQHHVFGDAQQPLNFRDRTKDEPAVSKLVLVKTFLFLLSLSAILELAEFRGALLADELFWASGRLFAYFLLTAIRVLSAFWRRWPRIRGCELWLKMDQCTLFRVCNCTASMFRLLFLSRQHECKSQYLPGTRILIFLSPEAIHACVMLFPEKVIGWIDRDFSFLTTINLN